MAGAAVLTLMGFELHLRRSATHVVARGTTVPGPVIEQNPELLVRTTPLGRRLIASSHVVIRNHALSKRDIEMDVNSLGFRGPEILPGREAGEWRILILGDSITWGDYLQDAETYVRRAEESLRSRARRGETIQVVNGGVGNVGLKEEIAILEEQGLAIHPDTVVVAFYLNDSRPPWGFDDEVAGRGWLRRHSLVADRIYETALLRHWVAEQGSESFRWTTLLSPPRWAEDRNTFLEVASLARDDWGAAWDAASWTALEAHFLRLRALSRTHGFQVAIVAFPVALQVYARFLEDEPQRTLGKTATRLGFRYCDLLPVLRKEHHGVNLYFDHCHPNVEGNEIIGRAVARFLWEEMRPQPPVAAESSAR